jgi:putative transcriptional regulator
MNRIRRWTLLALLTGLLPLAAPAVVVDTDAPAIFLVAKPELHDPNFAQSVVLVVFPHEAGPIGVILNRPTQFAVKDGFPDQPLLKSRADMLFFGGPVQPTGLMYLFRGSAGTGRAFPVVGELFLSADSGLLDDLLTRHRDHVQRWFLGYSGWSKAQLEREIALGAWYVIEADQDTVAHADPKTIWRDLVLRATAVKT